jgi:prepilin-type N-terminal cleavage/methylation domain-containing protein
MRRDSLRAGFTLVEVALAMAILSVLAAAVIPVAIRQVELQFAQRTGREMSLIQEAAKWFYVDRRRWPTSISELQTGRYLNRSWNGRTPWGQSYTLRSTSSSFSISAPVPAGVAGQVRQLVVMPSSASQGADVVVTSTVPVPGREASLAMLVHKEGDTMTGPLRFSGAGGTAVISIDPGPGTISATGDVAGGRLCIGTECRAAW